MSIQWIENPQGGKLRLRWAQPTLSVLLTPPSPNARVSATPQGWGVSHHKSSVAPLPKARVLSLFSRPKAQLPTSLLPPHPPQPLPKGSSDPAS